MPPKFQIIAIDGPDDAQRESVYIHLRNFGRANTPEAPKFYQAAGYEVVGRIEDWDSHGQAKIVLRKVLQ